MPLMKMSLNRDWLAKGLVLLEATKNTFVLHRKSKLSEKDLIDFTYILNLILTSGVPIMSGLSDMATQSSNKRMATAASFLHSKLESGKSISDSMRDYPELFPPFYASMVGAGEVAGNLEQVLNDIMKYLEWQMKLKKDIRAALAYPIIVLTAVFCLIAILFIFVMPKVHQNTHRSECEPPPCPRRFLSLPSAWCKTTGR